MRRICYTTLDLQESALSESHDLVDAQRSSSALSKEEKLQKAHGEARMEHAASAEERNPQSFHHAGSSKDHSADLKPILEPQPKVQVILSPLQDVHLCEAQNLSMKYTHPYAYVVERGGENHNNPSNLGQEAQFGDYVLQKTPPLLTFQNLQTLSADLQPHHLEEMHLLETLESIGEQVSAALSEFKNKMPKS
jgi:hypothetical protein